MFSLNVSRVAPDIRPFYIRYPVGYPVSLAGYPAESERSDLISLVLVVPIAARQESAWPQSLKRGHPGTRPARRTRTGRSPPHGTGNIWNSKSQQ